MPSIQHLLETHFSVDMGRELSQSWLAERLELLRALTLPSVAAQTTRRFTWLLLCDRSTDPGTLERLREEERSSDRLRVVLTGNGTSPVDAVRAEVRRDADVLITTRLDSDDAIADRYLEAVQEYAGPFHRSSHETLLVNFPRGYRLDVRDRSLYETWLPNAPFHSLFERPRHGVAKTLRSAGHRDLLQQRYARFRRLSPFGDGAGATHVRIHQHYPTLQDESIDAWLVGVHGGNLLNRIGPPDRRLAPGSEPPGFTLRLDARR